MTYFCRQVLLARELALTQLEMFMCHDLISYWPAPPEQAFGPGESVWTKASTMWSQLVSTDLNPHWPVEQASSGFRCFGKPQNPSNLAAHVEGGINRRPDRLKS